jgi:hypothetical protein
VLEVRRVLAPEEAARALRPTPSLSSAGSDSEAAASARLTSLTSPTLPNATQTATVCPYPYYGRPNSLIPPPH